MRWESGNYIISNYFNSSNYINNTIYDDCECINIGNLPTFICNWKSNKNEKGIEPEI